MLEANEPAGRSCWRRTMEDLGVQLWRAGRIQGLDAEAQMFAQGNMLQTFANRKEILPKVRGSERFKGERKDRLL